MPNVFRSFRTSSDAGGVLAILSVNELPNAYIVAGVLNALLPSHPAPINEPQSQPADIFPTLFHLWSIINRSKAFDIFFIDLLSRIARDHIACSYVPFGSHGIFSKDQSDLIFTAILRLTQIPPYESIDTFFHPSNQGSWTTCLSVDPLTSLRRSSPDGIAEQSGELDLPEDRKINDGLKKRFVMALKELHSWSFLQKQPRVLLLLQRLARTCISRTRPGFARALQRFYPSLQGLVEVHRTTSSLNGLQMIANIMSKHKGYRCHITARLALALPGIDANDLNKTQYTLNFIQSVAYSIPMVPLVKEGSHIHDTTLAMEWVPGQMDRMEREGHYFEIVDYWLGEFILTLLGKVFTLLENLPDANQVRGGTPEDNVINALPAALSPLFASLSPELFDMALEKVATFVSSHVVHQHEMQWHGS
ncbi:hypothetical protein ACKAV7_006281 [Fusarium commune]